MIAGAQQLIVILRRVGLLYSDHDYTEEAYNNSDFKVVDGKFDVMFFYWNMIPHTENMFELLLWKKPSESPAAAF